MSMKVYIFEGGESIDTDDTVEMAEWSEEAMLVELTKCYGEDWLSEVIDGANYAVIDGPNITIKDTLYVVSDNLAQIVTDNIDGGMTYIVRAN